MKYAKDGICECFTCGTRRPIEQMQCGHGISGRGNYILFLEEICRPQCEKCNIWQGGAYEIFVPKLCELYTKSQYWKWYYESRKPFKRSKQDYIDLVYDLQDKIAHLENQEGK